MQLLRNRIGRFIEENRLVSAGDTVIVAVSGGADSMALLDILANLSGYRLTLVPAHLNHCLRGEESDGDELFVRQAARRYGLTAEILRVDVAAAADATGVSLEEAGREARYGFFRELAARYNARAIALAHHRDDQAETVLMRLVRGSAGSGLVAIRPGGDGDLLIRPLLSVSRADIEAYLRQGGLEWREDSSNSDTRFLRNRIRHELLPLLRSYNPCIAENLAQTAAALARDEELLCQMTAAAFGRCVKATGRSRIVDLDLLECEPAALRPRLFRMVIAAVKGDLRRISSRHLAALEDLASSRNPSGRTALPDGLLAFREYRLLHISAAAHVVSAAEEFSLDITGSGSFRLPDGATLSVDVFQELTDGWRSQGRRTLWVNRADLPFPWELRYFRAGDRFRPMGMEGEKKLKKLFIDRKIPIAGRRRIPLLLCRGEIFWVGGVQAGVAAGHVTAGTEVVRLQLGEYTI